MDHIYIEDVRFGSRTIIDDHTLLIDRQELISLLAQEPLFDSIEIALAHPGQSCRIIYVLDVLEPRYRLNGSNFPGALEAMGLVGDGRTRALKNVCVVEVSPDQARGRNIIDMSGPVTDYSPLGATHNVVLIPHAARAPTAMSTAWQSRKPGCERRYTWLPRQRKSTPTKRKSTSYRPPPSTVGPKNCRASAISSRSTPSNIRRIRRRRFLRQQHSGIPADDRPS